MVIAVLCVFQSEFPIFPVFFVWMSFSLKCDDISFCYLGVECGTGSLVMGFWHMLISSTPPDTIYLLLTIKIKLHFHCSLAFKWWFWFWDFHIYMSRRNITETIQDYFLLLVVDLLSLRSAEVEYQLFNLFQSHWISQ